MDIQEILNLGIMGGITSMLLELITSYMGKTASKVATVLLSLVVGSVYVLFADASWFATVLGVLVSASTAYAFFIKK